MLKGATGTAGEDLGYSIDLRYLEFQFPLALTVPIRDGSLRPRLYSGVAIGLELSCNVEFRDPVLRTRVGCARVFREEFGFWVAFTQTTPIDIGWLFGGGIDLAVGPGALTADFRYNLGLSNINNLPELPLSIKNRALQFLGGYVFYFGGRFKPLRTFPS